MSYKHSRFRSFMFGTLVSVGLATQIAAAPVTLTVDDGSVTITGDLVSFEGGFFVINTALGDMRIAASRVQCEGVGCPVIEEDTNDVVIAGSEAIGSGMMPLLLTGYGDFKEAVAEVETTDDGLIVADIVGDQGFGDSIAQFVVNPSSSTNAFVALANDEAEIGMSSRQPTAGETAQVRNTGGGNLLDATQERIIAVDSLVVIVNQANPIRQLTLQQLGQIYNGQLTNWAALGGLDAPIVAFGREAGSGTGELFESVVFSYSGGNRAATIRSVDTNEEMANAVNADPNAIGFVGYAFQRGAKPVNIVDQCGIGVTPDAFSAKAEEYPLQRRLYLYNTSDNLSEEAQDFLTFAASTRADGVIAKAGFIDLGVARDRREGQGGRVYDTILATSDPGEIPLMREMVVEMLQYDRLSTTFRFASGSSQLEAKAYADLDRLIDYLNTIPDDVEISLVGFSDADGSFEANRSLSLGRAQQVAQAVADYALPRLVGNVIFTAKGFGELSPIACNDTLEGKTINRRVEVWIRRIGG